MMDNGFMKISEVAKRLQVSTSWVYKKCKAGIIPHVRIGHLVRFNEKDIEQWISGHKINGKLKI